LIEKNINTRRFIKTPFFYDFYKSHKIFMLHLNALCKKAIAYFF